MADLLPVTERVALLRAEVLRRDLRGEIPPLRAQLAEDVLATTLDRPQPERMAAILDAVFHRTPVVIRPQELLVGSRGADGYPEVDDAVARGSAEYPYLIADFQTLLEQGLSGVIARAQERLYWMDEAEPSQMDAVYFLRSVITACRAVAAWAARYADEAERQAQETADPARRQELLEIAARCRRVPAQPAASFADAVQSVWFLYVALYLETPAASCLGRLDQYLYPYYQADLAAGTLTREQAKEWLCCLWVKLYENVLGVLGSHAQTVTLGGVTADGADAVNALSFLCIEVAESMGNVGAQIAIRWTEGQDSALPAAAFRLMQRGAIMPQLFNDDVYLAALSRLGVPAEDARQYALFGCHEPVIAGMGYQRPASWPGYVSFYDWFETAMGLQSTGVPAGVWTTPCEELPTLRVVRQPPKSTEELWDRWMAATRDGIRQAVIQANYGDVVKRQWLPRPLMSAFLRDCINRATDLTAGGARYNMTGFQGCALATAVDAFMAVKTLVFEQGRISMPELIAALTANFQGFAAMRQLLLHGAPRYGVDCDEADQWARRLVRAYCDELEMHRNVRGGRFTPGLWSFTQNVNIGYRTAASPDGRLAGTPISHSMDPVAGQATAGPTAVINSAARLEQRLLANGGSLLLEFAPAVIEHPDTRAKALELCETYFRLGGIELQLSCASVEQLQAARANPEAYQDLVVRVAGYSDFFVRLSADLQEYIIGREKHTLAGRAY